MSLARGGPVASPARPSVAAPPRLHRRALLAAAGALAGSCLGLAGCASPAARPALASDEAQELAPGVFMLRGASGEIGPDNLGRTGNVGFIVGPGGVIVVDCGVSARHGRAVLAAIRRRTALPIRQLVLTHVRQEFLFGAAAFEAEGIPVLMHRSAARLMAARCETCLKTLIRVLGADEMAATRVIRPQLLVDPAEAGAPALLADIGRPLRLLAAGRDGHSSGPGDLALLDERSGTLLAGGWLDADTIPDVQDADFNGWREALATAAQLKPQVIIPGHGPAAGPGLIATIARYLDQLEARTAELLQAGTALSEVADETRLPEFAGWDQYDSIHRRNASVVFLRQERALMLRP